MEKESKQSRVWLGKYAELRREYLIKHRRGTYGVLLGEGKLTEHLEKIEEEAQEMLANILSRAVKEQGITEELKARDPLLWVQKMNQAKASAEEVVLREVVYRWSKRIFCPDQTQKHSGEEGKKTKKPNGREDRLADE